MVRSRRSISKEDASSVLADSGISLSSPPAATASRTTAKDEDSDDDFADIELDEAALLEQLCNSDDDGDYVVRNMAKEQQMDEEEKPTTPKKSVIVESGRKRKLSSKLVLKTPSKSLKRTKLTGNKAKDWKVEQSLEATRPTTEQPDESLATALPTAVDVIADAACSSAADLPDDSGSVKAKGRKTHICNVCQKEFGGSTDLKRHSLIHSDERPHKCEQCGKCYRQAVNLKNHITTAHQGRKQFGCKLCPKSFALKERLRLHMRLHSGEKPYACDYCEKTFARGGQLQQHIVTHHKSKVKQFVCGKCSASFSSNANLRAHMERHEQGPDHYCEICNEHFSNEVVLRAHVNKMHYKLRQFDCEVCKKTIEDDDLATHMKTHAHVKLHICDVCNAYFTQKSQYNVHLRMHTGERPYQCRICWQTFAHSSVLKLHIRKHTGEKPFRCPLCKDEVAFSQLAHLKTHMKKIHKQDNPYRCDGCSSFFKIKVELQAHMEQCKSCDDDGGPPNSANQDMQALSHLRFLLALLIKKISSEQKLQQLGYEKRLIDNVIVASLKLANRKACDDQELSAIARMRLNVEEFLNWIVPAKVMQTFREQKLTVEVILDKIVTMYMKQK